MRPIILDRAPLGFPWITLDPFLFCVHHDDAYPKANAQFGPDVSLAGRNIGNDFTVRDGFRMYHGDVVPGFPQHPHRGFETVTIVRRGLIDHSDSLGATARFGRGDVQWLTAGKGIVHSEMFPLLSREEANPVELFQIWLNLPAEDKFADPHFTMLWGDTLPRIAQDGTEVTVVAGAFGEHMPPAPPPHSWASRETSDVAIWTLRLDPHARLLLPRAKGEDTVRVLYFFHGTSIRVGTEEVTAHGALVVRCDEDVELVAGDSEVELLVLQGKPIAEPVAQHGPFVMNTQAEIQQAIRDYQHTRFGGWPHANDGPVHGALGERFARHADGRIEQRGV